MEPICQKCGKEAPNYCWDNDGIYHHGCLPGSLKVRTDDELGSFLAWFRGKFFREPCLDPDDSDFNAWLAWQAAIRATGGTT
jgi:hypothetical protein